MRSGPATSDGPVTLLLTGDVMTGRGVDQILAHPSAPQLHEAYLRSAADYVELAERAHGPIPRRVSPAYVWGVLPEVLAREAPHARLVNLETAVTTCEDAAPKGINYRMHPANVDVLGPVGIDCCVLANNHVLDWGRRGLLDTLAHLRRAGLRVAGAGRDLVEARTPATIAVAGRACRVVVLACCTSDAGVPATWRATANAPGVHLLPDLSDHTVDDLASLVAAVARADDVVVTSIHWGGNWGEEVPSAHRRFAHALVERARVDVVYGHSSHHPKGIEVHAERPIFYGCGDFLDDYEGIGEQARFRADHVLAYFPTLDARTHALVALRMAPLLIRNFRLQHAAAEERDWLCATLDGLCRRFRHRVEIRDDVLTLRV